jgi:hypothetical protein
MKIDKEEFLNDLQMVKSGLSSKELLEQSSCYVFKDGHVFTFNDEVACRKKTAMAFEGAVPAKLLLATLEKLKADTHLEVLENPDGQLEFRGVNKRFAITRDAQISLPIEKVTEETPTTWAKLPENFGDVINKVKDCVSTDEANNFSLTCVHFHPNYIEACDNRQLLRWHVSLGNKRSLLVRGNAIGHIVGLGVSKVSSTQSWIHFKNAAGLIFSCRKFVEEYPQGMDAVLAVKGEPIKLPKGIIEASDRAAEFSKEEAQGIEPVVGVHLWPGGIRIEGTGQAGWYKETKKCNYSGPKIDFVMTPVLLQHITNNFNDAVISQKKLRATGGHKDNHGAWEYVTVLGTPKKKAAPAPAEDDTDDPKAEDPAD